MGDAKAAEANSREEVIMSGNMVARWTVRRAEAMGFLCLVMLLRCV
jgi:hypothetical protein